MVGFCFQKKSSRFEEVTSEESSGRLPVDISLLFNVSKCSDDARLRLKILTHAQARTELTNNAEQNRTELVIRSWMKRSGSKKGMREWSVTRYMDSKRAASPLLIGTEDQNVRSNCLKRSSHKATSKLTSTSVCGEVMLNSELASLSLTGVKGP